MHKSIYLSDNCQKASGAGMISLLLFLLLILPCICHGAINVDGVISEAEWESAQSLRDFIVVDPWNLGLPRVATEAKVLSLSEGLAVAFICDQPPEENRTRTTTRRDASSFDSDYISLMIDFDGTHQTGYEFSVSITGSYRDGVITDESKISYDWDGIWQRAVNEDSQRWTVEILLPWSIVAMREGDGDTRRIAACFQRVLNVRNEKFSYPAAGTARNTFMSDFAKIEVTKHADTQFDILPYVTVLSDLANNNTKGKAGLDVFWKPSGKFQLAATANPDFGQVESDDLVINFSATETFLSDKRPFFTENQGLFALTTPPSSYIIHTRRIGAKSDDGNPSSDIDAALKVIGSSGSMDFGIFAAQESGDSGRSFYAGRLKIPSENWSLGMVTTYAERPFLDRKALVNSLDYTLSRGHFYSRGRVIMSKIDQADETTTGYGAYATISYKPTDKWLSMMTYSLYDDRLDFNDMGYMARNNWSEGFINTEWKQTDFPEDSRTASVTWSLRYTRSYNYDGVHLPDCVTFSRAQKMRSGSDVSGQITYFPGGYDDLISRGNGLVFLNDRLNASISWSTQRRGMWRKALSFKLVQEGYDGYGIGFDASASFYPQEDITIDLSLKPLWSRDWLIWMRDDQLAGFSRRQVSMNIGATWFPAERHEIRLRGQWLVINADARQAYRIGAGSRLVESSDIINDFAAINFGLQFRYKYELGPLSEIYLVYSRGGLDHIDNPEGGTLGLFTTASSLRNSDQVLAKLRYRF